jgi:hypothetical protein
MSQRNVRLIAGATVAAMALGSVAVTGVAIARHDPGGSRTVRQRLTISRTLPDGPPGAGFSRRESEGLRRTLPTDHE